MLIINSKEFTLALAKAGMTINELNDKSGVGKSTISKILKSETSVRPSILGKLAGALNVKVEDLIN